MLSYFLSFTYLHLLSFLLTFNLASFPPHFISRPKTDVENACHPIIGPLSEFASFSKRGYPMVIGFFSLFILTIFSPIILSPHPFDSSLSP